MKSIWTQNFLKRSRVVERIGENSSEKNDGGRTNGERSIVQCNITPVTPSVPPSLFFPHYYFLPLSSKLSPTITLFQRDSQLRLNIVFIVNSA